MPLSTLMVTGTWVNDDGTPASGRVEFKRYNGGHCVEHIDKSWLCRGCNCRNGQHQRKFQLCRSNCNGHRLVDRQFCDAGITELEAHHC